MEPSPKRFEVDDTVILRRTDDAERDLIARVDRTYHNLTSHEPLDDSLVIAYVPIPEDVLRQFALSGKPPKGYIFVEFALEHQGFALLPETSVRLFSRALSTGDIVKQDANSAMFGTVVNVSSTYFLKPAFSSIQDLRTPRDFKSESIELPRIELAGSSEQSRCFVAKGADLKRAADFQGGDNIVYRDWYGVVEDADIDVAVLLENMTVVWVEKPWQLEIVVSKFQDEILVSMPELDDIHRPDILNVHGSGVVSIPAKRIGCGDMVVTSRKNLENGRWLVGKYDTEVPAQGRVLDVRTRSLEASWLAPNPFARAESSPPPSSELRPYENLTSFRNPRELRLRKELLRYDHHNRPTEINYAFGTGDVSAGDVYYPGDRVRYKSLRQRAEDPNFPTPDFIPRTESFDFDVNDFLVCAGRHSAIVLWQNGTRSKVETIELTPYSLPESDLSPGNLVMAKEGLKMTFYDPSGSSHTSDFNEMSFFERDHVLRPSKVGVIQSVDAQERLALVRWYENPQIQLSAYGQMLQQALFGPIGEEVEAVSLYEIMTSPALVRKLGDLVMIPPGNPAPEFTSHIQPAHFVLHASGPTTLYHLHQTSADFSYVIRQIAQPFTHLLTPESIGGFPCDWLGEIIEIGLGGWVIVRLGCLKDCRDIRVPQENILLILDDGMEFPHPEDHMAVDSMDEDLDVGESIDLSSDEEFPIDEVVEYEGGMRLDNESGEDNWSTDDDSSEVANEIEKAVKEGSLEHTEMNGTQAIQENNNTESPTSVPAQIELGRLALPFSENQPPAFNPSIDETQLQLEKSAQDPTGTSLAQHLRQQQPPVNFEVLEQLPPKDQYNRNEMPTQNPTFLKRIAKEHRILASSLPNGEIYVRTYESRLDLLRCLIIGPADTPYEDCPFIIDLYLGPQFPKEPPKAHFHSWTSGLGRINPNLYEEGKICLSLLGTWPGQSAQEGWSDSATLLQLLVSLQGLVFVSQPFYNEAGFEAYGEEKVYSVESQQYSEKAYVMARGFAKYALLKAPSGTEDILAWLYLCVPKAGTEGESPPRLLAKVIQRAKLLMVRSEDLKRQDTSEKADAQASTSSVLIDGVGNSGDSTKTFLRPLSQGASVMLKKIVLVLEDTLRQYDAVELDAAEGEPDPDDTIHKAG